MKKLLYLAFVSLFTLLIVSCGKKKSTDLPLPTARKESVYITTNNNNLISYNPANGTKHWEISLNGASEGVPVLYKKKLYIVTNSGYFYAIDIVKGEISLEKDIQKPSRFSIAVDNDKVYIASDSLYCYDLNGSMIWKYDPGTSTPCTSSPQVANSRVYLGLRDMIHAVDANSGGPVWVSPSASGLDIVSSPRVSNGLVYFGGLDKKIYALNESDGSLKWEYLTGDKILSSPMVYGGMCITGSADYGVYCIDTTSPTLPPNGELRWKYKTIDRVNSCATVHEVSNTILVGGHDFNLYAIDHVSGTLKWKYPASSIIETSPVVYGEYVYFASVDRYLYCVDVRNGNTVWKSFLNGSSKSSPMVDDLKNGLYPSVSGMSKY
ncbi:MAG TPA: PQQ-binding-like beta-propeller repeat protein [Chitinophagaceae bacterium]|nr:PQQ-binding-like beta-propeller repeat protein [Chitinophagaceae bacterium]